MDIVKLILTSLLSIVALFITTKIQGHKQVAQLDFFDYVVGITVGSIGAELATELEAPWKPLIAIIVYCVASVGLATLTHKRPRFRKYINGAPTIIMSDGKLYRENMKKAKLDLTEFMLMCREQGFFDINDIFIAVFEADGRLSILPRSAARPMTPRDAGLAPAEPTLNVEVIMDGRILGENLARMGLDARWLGKRLAEAGYRSPKEIFLALCDSEHHVSFFAASQEIYKRA